MGFFKRRKKSINKEERRDLFRKHATEIIETVEEKVDAEKVSSQDLAEKILQEAQEFVTANSEATTIAELDPEEKAKSIALLKNIAEIIIQSDKIPDEAAGDFIKNIIQQDSTAVGVAVAAKVPSLPDESIQEIIETPEVDVKAAERLIDGIDDEDKKREIQEKIKLEKIEKLYDRCDTIKIDKFISEINEIQTDSDVENSKIKRWIERTIAKEVAYNFYTQSYLSMTKICKAMSPVEMLEINLPELAEDEFGMIKIKHRSKDEGRTYSYDKKLFRRAIIEQIAIEAADQFKSQSADKRAYIIPNTESMLSLSSEEKEWFMEKLESRTKSSNGVVPSGRDLKDAMNQLNGFGNVEEIVDLKVELESIDNAVLRKNIANDFYNILQIVQKFPEDQQESLMGLISQMSGEIAKQFENRIQKVEEKNNEENKSDTQNAETSEELKPKEEQTQEGSEPGD